MGLVGSGRVWWAQLPHGGLLVIGLEHHNNALTNRFWVDLKSSKTEMFVYQNRLLRPNAALAWLEDPGVLFLGPEDKIWGFSQG